MFFKKTCTTTMFNAPPTPPLTKAILNKAISMLNANFAKMNTTITASGVSTGQAGKMIHNFNSMFWGQSKLNLQWVQMSLSTSPFPTPNLRRLPSTTMTKKEIEIQKALGTLPYKEWMKIHHILFENKWWYFPIPKAMECKSSKTIAIDGIEHYPVADGYIDDLQHSMNGNNWSEEHFAEEIIIQCYSCMSLMEIDH